MRARENNGILEEFRAFCPKEDNKCSEQTQKRGKEPACERVKRLFSPNRAFVVTCDGAHLPRIPHDLRHIELRFREDPCKYIGDIERLPEQNRDELGLEDQS